MTIEFANRLAELRKAKGLSQEELADKLGVSRQAVSKWERGEASPDTDNLIELAKIYGISLDELVGLSKQEEKKENNGIHIEAGESSIHIENPRIHLKDDEGEVRIGKDGIHITDKEDGEVHITKDGIKVEGEEIRKHVHVHHDHNWEKTTKTAAALFFFTLALVLITYITLGVALDLWAKAWVLFFAPTIVSDTYKTFANKDLDEFPYTTIVVATYLTLCAWVFNYHLWHPLWVMFLSIPLFGEFKKLIRTLKK